MSNRTIKLKLFLEQPNCWYCNQPMVLTNISKGKLPDNSATLEHLISRFHIGRWLQKKNKNQRRKVLACHRCNQNRSISETLCLSRAEILKRSRGFSLSPKGKPKIIKPLPTVTAVTEALDDSV